MKVKYLLIAVFLIVLSCKKEKPQLNTNPTIPQNGSQSITIIQDEFEDTPIVVAGSGGKNFIVSFKRTLEDGTLLDFFSTDDPLPVIMKDNEGNSWDIFGNATSGDRKGERLSSTRSMMGYWFIFNAMYPGVDIYGEGPVIVYQPPTTAAEGWSIATTNVVHSLGFDAIPAIDNPSFVGQEATVNSPDFSYLKDEGLVVGFVEGDVVRAYPHAILNWNEIVNDDIDNLNFSVIFCPLTGTSQVWNREINNTITTFGVSGKLYNSNVMPYDRLTNSIWTQLDAKSVFGDLVGKNAERFPFVETTWSTWKEIYPSSNVLKAPQEYSWNYAENPYGNYLENSELILFPVEIVDNRMSAKERVHAIIINRQAKVYRFEDF